MNTTSDMIRKAAVLVSSLDDDMADKLLDQMPPAMADQVRRAMALLDQIDPAEQEAAIADFVRGEAGASSEPPDEDHEGVALSAKLAREFGLVAKTAAKAPASADSMGDMTSPAGEQPFQSLRGEATSRISPLLADENPQTIALVAAHLPPAQALEILAALPLHVQSEVMRRMADLDEAHPDILREVDRGLALTAPIRTVPKQGDSR